MQKTFTQQKLEEQARAMKRLSDAKAKEKELERKLTTITYKRNGATVVVRTTDKEYNKEAMKKLGWEVVR